uniref:TLC domain-containing protein n=1 Tax=Syphacia muris TaxID=451379 RepID=A0A0N5AF35_9BILA
MVDLRRSVGGRGKKSSPPIFSHEFIIQNHGDIMSCVVMLIVMGLFFQITTPLATIFIVPQYNETIENTVSGLPQSFFGVGSKDLFAILFYAVGWIVIHAILQEHIFDKLQRKLHMSKSKMSKFAESGQLAFFAIYSVIHSGNLFLGRYILHDLLLYTDITKLWVGYPETHRLLTLHTKLFFIFQIAYWIHQFPEYYFQKVRKEDMRSRTTYSIIFLLFITVGYFLNFNRLTMTLLFLEYISQAIFHTTRLFYFAEKWNIARTGFKIWNVVFMIVRLASAVITVLTLWYGHRTIEVPYIDIASGNYNTAFIRLNSMLCILALQLFMLFNFVKFHLRRIRERRSRQRVEKQPRLQPKKKKPITDEVRIKVVSFILYRG